MFKKIYRYLNFRISRKKFAPFEVSSLRTAGTYKTWHKRPKFRSRLPIVESSKDYSNFSIVCQGQVVEKDNFTLETLALYRKFFPTANLILSTWDGLESSVREKFEAIGVHVIQSPLPMNKGISNTNLQIVSSYQGIKYAQSKSSDFVLKTRTDQRIYAPDSLDFFENLLGAFPLNSKSGRQNQRLVALGLDTFKYRIYGLSDFLLFGTTEDVLAYWDCPLDDKKEIPRFDGAIDGENYARQRICEAYFYSHFLESMDHKLTWTLDDWWQSVGDRFAVVDAASIDFFWPKYTSKEFRWNTYEPINGLTPMGFRDWLGFQQHTKTVPSAQELNLVRTKA